MPKRAIYSVTIDGQDVTAGLTPFLLSLRVSDKAGTVSDTADLSLDDTDGQIILPRVGAVVEITLGWADEGAARVFKGTVDDVRSRGSAGGGREVSVSAKGVDTTGKGKAKQQQKKNFDNKKLKEVLEEAGKDADIVDVKVHPDYVEVTFDYEAIDDESYIQFGQRIARQIGATFKIQGDQAVVVPKNKGENANGEPLPTVTAEWGWNLHQWDIAPILGRSRYKKTRGRFYDREEAKWKEVEVDVEVEDAEVELTTRMPESSEDHAKRRADNEAKDSDRDGGEGSVTIEGNIEAQPEGKCQVVGARPGIDGLYLIETVDHEYSPGSGFITKLSLKQPKGEAGKDKRKPSGSAAPTAPGGGSSPAALGTGSVA